MASNNRFCVFCGNKPEKQNREHILPQWLLKLTGDPKRVVNFGINFNAGRTITFDWLNFVVPACESCNSEYSRLDGRAKSYVLTLLDRGALTSIEYMDFMDWMDKVRIGVWIAYHFIQGNPTNIEPRFHIKTRISQKDRMIAIYPIANDEKGLNAFGAESLIFHSQPSCIGLKINNILILNMSSDFLFSSRCGFPFPKNCFTTLDGENAYMMHTSDFSITRKIKHPLIRKQIIKPSIHLYQPIMAESEDKRFQSGFAGDYTCFDSYLAKHTLQPYPSGKGILYFQHLDKVAPIFDLDKPIDFDTCEGIHSKPMYKLTQQVYELQNLIYKQVRFIAKNRELKLNHAKKTKLLLKWNDKMITHYSTMENS